MRRARREAEIYVDAGVVRVSEISGSEMGLDALLMFLLGFGLLRGFSLVFVCFLLLLLVLCWFSVSLLHFVFYLFIFVLFSCFHC